MTSLPGQSDVSEAPEPVRVHVFEGRTGIGHEVKVDQVGDWLDVVFHDRDGERRGFSLNSMYTAALAQALVQVLAFRATASVRAEEATQRAEDLERQVGVMREAAARLRPLARRAVTEGGASGDQARADLREAINWLMEQGR